MTRLLSRLDALANMKAGTQAPTFETNNWGATISAVCADAAGEIRRLQSLVDDKTPDYEFTTDGCSGFMTWFWRTVLRHDPPWEGCCEAHDKLYWAGGTSAQRKEADRELMACVRFSKHPVISVLMYWAVRAGGHPLLPLPWRWGYGWKYPRGYDS